MTMTAEKHRPTDAEVDALLAELTSEAAELPSLAAIVASPGTLAEIDIDCAEWLGEVLISESGGDVDQVLESLTKATAARAAVPARRWVVARYDAIVAGTGWRRTCIESLLIGRWAQEMLDDPELIPAALAAIPVEVRERHEADLLGERQPWTFERVEHLTYRDGFTGAERVGPAIVIRPTAPSLREQFDDAAPGPLTFHPDSLRAMLDVDARHGA